jgi:hypothetical protein
MLNEVKHLGSTSHPFAAHEMLKAKPKHDTMLAGP